MSDESAEWTLHPIAEREIAAERRQVTGDRRVGWALAFAALGLCPLTCLGAVMEALSPTALVVTLVAVVLLGAEKTRRSDRTARLARAKRRDLRDAYGAVAGWTVELTVFQGAVPTGRDRGVLWFEDDRLFFLGERTSFGLAAHQTERTLDEGWPLAGLRALHTLRLRHRTRAGRVALGLDFIPRFEGTAESADAAEFRKALAAWSDRAASAPGGLPPLAPGPDAPSQRALLVAAVASTTFWVAVALGLAVVAWRTAWWVAPPVAAFAGVILVLWSDVWAPRLRWRAWRDRRRLDERAER